MAIFKLTDSEQAEFDKWLGKHLEKHQGKLPYAGAIGGSIFFEVVNTSIGQLVNVVCAHCNERHLLNGDDI